MFKQIEEHLNALSQRKALSLNLRNLQTDSDDCQVARSGVIRVGIPSVIGTYLFPRLISAFCSKYPQYELNMVEAGSAAITRLLQEGKLDIGFAVLFGEMESLGVMPIATGQMMVCLSPCHRLSDMPLIPLAELRDERMIMLRRGTFIRQMIIEQCNKNNFSPNIVFSTSQLQTMLRLVQAEVGITFLLDFVARDQQGILCKPLEDPILVKSGLVWSKGQPLSEEVIAFIEVVKAVFNSNDSKPADVVEE